MGLYDRDYYRVPQPGSGGVGQVRIWSITTWLIIVNVAVYVIDTVLMRMQMQSHGLVPRATPAMAPLEWWGYFSIYEVAVRAQVWRVITCQFLHAGLMHLLVNMFGLYLLGPLVELNLGARRYGFFYLLCGVAGPLMYTVMWGFGVLIHDMHTPLVGASAGIFGVLIAAAYLFPNRLISMYFFELPLKYFAWIMMGIAAYTVLVHGRNAGGEAAHLGGGILGWVLIRRQAILKIVSPKRRLRPKAKDWSRDMNR